MLKSKKKLIEYKLFYKIYLLYFYFKFKLKYLIKKKSYSQFGEDLIIDKFFKNFRGKYVDIGCFHPIKYSNTLLLYKRGWNGLNIDLNPASIDLFKISRTRDSSILACLSDKKKNVVMYYDNQFSALNSISKDNLKNFRIKNLKKIKTKTKVFIDVVKENFDFLNIDAEGQDFKILKTIDLKRFTPKLINIEVEPINKKDIYKYLEDNGYKILKIKSASHIFKKEKK
jgi:hypothetical protein